MNRARKPPRRCRTITSDKVISDDHDIPPDPSTSPAKERPQCLVDRSSRCMLSEIDSVKLATIITSQPAARGTALLLQALRQQVSVAASSAYTHQAVEWIAENDVLMLKMRKHSVLCRVLQSDAVDSREQMARLINTICSFPRGRQYFIEHLKTFLPTVVAVLRGRRLPTTTHEQLISAIEKMSLRSPCQRELLQCGMLEWIVNLLEGKFSQYAVEYACALAINLTFNSACPSLLIRFADSLSLAIVNVLNKEIHGPCCSLFNSLVFMWLGCSKVRYRAKETKLSETLRNRLTKKNCSLCALHVPYLLAIISGDAEISKVPQSPNEHELDTAGDCCEREVDSTDPLRPTSNELSGARLLLRRALKECPPDEQSNVPGQVPRYSSVGRTTTSSKTKNLNHEQQPQRLGTAASCHTFIIETERRRPPLLPVSLTDGAVEYKKSQDAAQKLQEEEAKRLEKEKAEKEASEKEKLKKRSISSRKPPLPKKDSITSDRKSPLVSHKQTKLSNEKLNRTPSIMEMSKRSPTTPHETSPQQENELSSPMGNLTGEEDYSVIFGARPKVARTPEHQPNRSFF
ncbi:unnamed protein product [Auanema sp. JU1783]|nr:unnamed protein product [Auanema sp. JU1783]